MQFISTYSGRSLKRLGSIFFLSRSSAAFCAQVFTSPFSTFSGRYLTIFFRGTHCVSSLSSARRIQKENFTLIHKNLCRGCFKLIGQWTDNVIKLAPLEQEVRITLLILRKLVVKQANIQQSTIGEFDSQEIDTFLP